MMVNFYNFFVNCDSPACPSWDNCQADVYDVSKHINHIKNVVGIDHVGIGGDFCGVTL